MQTTMDGLEVERRVEIPFARRRLVGDLCMPPGAGGVVLFAHGGDGGRSGLRSQFVARAIRGAGLGTLLLDLLAEDEVGDRRRAIDIEMMAARLLGASIWLGRRIGSRGLRLGYLGAGTGAAAALIAAAARPDLAAAVVSRGGRPDLARERLPDVKAPTLLLVGALDEEVLELNRRALALLRCPRDLVVVPGATHLFPEPGALEAVAGASADWFGRHLIAPRRAAEISGRRRTP